LQQQGLRGPTRGDALVVVGYFDGFKVIIVVRATDNSPAACSKN
jgi:hypothetical protein